MRNTTRTRTAPLAQRDTTAPMRDRPRASNVRRGRHLRIKRQYAETALPDIPASGMFRRRASPANTVTETAFADSVWRATSVLEGQTVSVATPAVFKSVWESRTATGAPRGNINPTSPKQHACHARWVTFVPLALSYRPSAEASFFTVLPLRQPRRSSIQVTTLRPWDQRKATNSSETLNNHACPETIAWGVS